MAETIGAIIGGVLFFMLLALMGLALGTGFWLAHNWIVGG